MLALLACGLVEVLIQRRPDHVGSVALLLPASVAAGGIGALAWTAFKVGALSFGGGFVIIPLMQGDAVHTYHWMTNTQFLNAVALGQVTPGPVVATVAAVGYAAHGLAGGLLAALVAFSPSFSFILLGGGRFEQLRDNERARAFLDGAGPAAIGAILGAAITLATALTQSWQFDPPRGRGDRAARPEARDRRDAARGRRSGSGGGARGRPPPALSAPRERGPADRPGERSRVAVTVNPVDPVRDALATLSEIVIFSR